MVDGAPTDSAALWRSRRARAVYLEGFAQADVDCAACLAVADELTRTLRKERTHHESISMLSHRDRVSSRPPDKERVTAYSVSELRVIELLEQVCPAMINYGQFTTRGLSTADGGAGAGAGSTGAGVVPYFQRLNNEGGDTAITISGHGLSDINSVVGRTVRDQLRRHCDALVESHEEEIAAIIRAGETSDVSSELCIRSASQCSAEQIERVPDEARLAGLERAGAAHDAPSNAEPPRKRRRRKSKRGGGGKAKDEV